jgi:hypothetical protein
MNSCATDIPQALLPQNWEISFPSSHDLDTIQPAALFDSYLSTRLETFCPVLFTYIRYYFIHIAYFTSYFGTFHCIHVWSAVRPRNCQHKCLRSRVLT